MTRGKGRFTVNTDQAFEMLTDAGLTEEMSIQTVKRWLRERKITYEGVGKHKNEFHFNDSNEALKMLMDAGLSESSGIQIIQRWVDEAKIQNTGYSEKGFHLSVNKLTERDKLVHQLKVKIKALNEHINGIEQLHQSSVNSLIQQRDRLNKEMSKQEHEKSELQRETKKLLKENSDLQKEILKMKERLSKGYEKREQTQSKTIPAKGMDHRQKLGLSKTATNKEVLAGYKKLLMITHPDHGGNPAAFHYIKNEYDYFRNSIKEK